MARTARPGNYAEQARTYDRTRGASPTVLREVTRFLGRGEGRSLLDVAAGTGNYAEAFAARGFRATLADVELAMVARSVPKVGRGRQVVADAAALPFRDGSFDAAVCINAIHLFDDPLAALCEARRVLRDGPLCFTAFTHENVSALFVFEYFGLDPHGERMSQEQLVRLARDAGFGRVEHATYVYTDTVDGSLNALHTNALHLAGPAYLRNNSFFHMLDEETRTKGLEALARDLRSGVLERRVKESYTEAASTGHGTVFAAWP